MLVSKAPHLVGDGFFPGLTKMEDPCRFNQAPDDIIWWSSKEDGSLGSPEASLGLKKPPGEDLRVLSHLEGPSPGGALQKFKKNTTKEDLGSSEPAPESWIHLKVWTCYCGSSGSTSTSLEKVQLPENPPDPRGDEQITRRDVTPPPTPDSSSSSSHRSEVKPSKTQQTPSERRRLHFEPFLLLWDHFDE